MQRIAADLPSAVRLFQKTGVEIPVLRELAGYLDTPGVEVFLASVPGTPSRLIDAIIQRGNEEALLCIAQNPNFLAKLASHPNHRVRMAVASNRRLTGQLIQMLATDSNAWVRVALAANPIILDNIQLKLASDPVPFVRLALLKNRKLTEEFQIGLGDDIDTTVHAITLMTPKLSYACMKIWAEFDEELGQLILARRDDLPDNLLKVLCSSKYPSVRRQLLEKRKLTPEDVSALAATADETVALSLLKQNELEPEVVYSIWNSCRDSAAVKMSLASHPSLTDEVALELLADADASLLEALAMNPGAALAECCRRLVLRGDAHLCKLMLANERYATDGELVSLLVEKVPENVFPHLVYRRADCSRLSNAARSRLAASVLPSVRALVK